MNNSECREIDRNWNLIYSLIFFIGKNSLKLISKCLESYFYVVCDVCTLDSL